MSHLSAYAHENFVRILILEGVILLTATLVLVLGGRWLIQRPLDKLVAKTRQIGAGDLSGTLVLSGRDELAKLATEINRMCGEIQAAQEAARKETERRLSAIEQLRHAERLTTLGRLSAGVAHELGTPLNVVAGRAKLITDPALTREEIVESAGIIREQAGRMTKIIRDLLNFARRRHPKKSPADLEALVRRVVKMLEPAARKAGIACGISTRAPVASVTVDEAQIEQVLMNLLVNGIEAMPNGGKLDVALDTEDRPEELGRARKYVVLSVTDTGEGIEAENLHHIFEPFFTTKDVGKGSGLGLSIAHGIVKEHDGWIDVKSQPGSGTTFMVFLPWKEEE
jgi:signal transduction histidine kinase